MWHRIQSAGEKAPRGGKRFLQGGLLAAVFAALMLGTAGVHASARETIPTAEEAYGSMMALQERYQEGASWTAGNAYTSKGNLVYRGFSTRYTGSGSAGFALTLSDAAFDDLPIYEHTDFSSLHVGDIVRMGGNTHSVIILSMAGDTMTVAEGDYEGTVRWGRTISRRDHTGWNYVMTRYGDPAQLKSIPMYRLYNRASDEHFYTSDDGERKALVGAGWRDEGIAWYAPSISGTPVYRLYNPFSGEHHYTTQTLERDTLAANGWVYEGIGWYSNDGEATPLYRLFNPKATGAGSHHYTADAGERDYLVSIGWRDEGIGWYGN